MAKSIPFPNTRGYYDKLHERSVNKRRCHKDANINSILTQLGFEILCL